MTLAYYLGTIGQLNKSPSQHWGASMFQIQIFNRISPYALLQLDTDDYECSEDGISTHFENPNAIVVRSHKLLAEDVPKSTLAVARAGIGVDNVDVEALTTRGIPVFNAPGSNANAVAELTLAGLLLAARNLVQAARFVEELPHDGEMMQAAEAGKKTFAGIELRDHTLGIIGLGAIGSIVANLATTFGMNIVGYDPELSLERALTLPGSLKLVDSLPALLGQSDFVSLHVPLIHGSKGTYHLIDTESLEACKAGLALINLSRAEIVNPVAIKRALDTDVLRMYVSDFPNDMLIDHKDVVFLPHLGASTGEAEENSAKMVIGQLREYLEVGNIKNAVNFPSISLPCTTGHRVTVTHSNSHGALAAITTILSDAKINIESSVNRSRGDIAYIIIDTNTPVSHSVLTKISALPHVFKARYLNPS